MSLSTHFKALIWGLLLLFYSNLAAQHELAPIAEKIQTAKACETTFIPLSLFEKTLDLTDERKRDLAKSASSYSLFNYTEQLPALEQIPTAIQLEIPSGPGSSMTLELLRVQILTDDFSLVTSESNGQAVPYKDGLHYQGIIAGELTSMAAISIYDGEVMGVVNDGQHSYILGRLETPDKKSREHVFYQEEDLLADLESTCDTESPPLSPEEELLMQQIANGSLNSEARMSSCISVYLELEYDLVNEKGGSNGALNYITGLWNVVNTLYQQESISTNINQVFAWSTPDNYPTGPSTGSALNAFVAARPNYPAELAHLISRGQPTGGGVAYINGLCNNIGYAYSYIHSNYGGFPTYSWSVNVLAHEMGHNLGSRHTHDCVWNGNNTAIDRCGPAAGYGADCNPPAPLPTSAVGGTVMSYCHLLSTGINFANGFGQQPGDLIRANLNNAATCLVGCNTNNCPFLTFQVTNVTCNGDADGTANLIITGGTPPFAYAWSNGSNSQSISNLASGNYSVTVTDAGNCTETATVFISEPAAIGIGVGGVNPSGAQNGHIGLTVYGGIAPYSYQWSINNGTTAYQSNLGPGTYNFTVTDNRGCSQTGSATLIDDMPSCNQTIIRVTIQADNFPEQNGYGIGDDQLVLFDQISPISSAIPAGGLISRNYCLADGCYAFGILDFQSDGMCNSNSGTPGYYLIENITEGTVIATACDFGFNDRVDFCIGDPLAISMASTDISCNGVDDGAATVTATDGTGVYTYAWSNGSTSAGITGLQPGTYSVTVTSGWYVESLTVTINEPSVLASSIYTYGPSNAPNNAVSTVTATGGTTPYSYLWSTGATTQQVNSLSQGNYSVTVTDANGCITIGAVTVNPPIVINPGVGYYSCYGVDDGDVLTAPTGGAGPGTYTYAWSNGATTQSIMDVSPGLYGVTVTSTSPTSTQVATFYQTMVYPAAMTSSTTTTPSTGIDGTAIATPGGGSPPYTYSWSNGATTASISNLAPGTYNVDITDSRGCVISDVAVVVNAGNPLQLSTSSNDASCNGSSDGDASVSATGGSGNYTYNWSNGATTATANNLSAGNYSVTVTSGAQTATANISIGEPAAIGLSFTTANTSYGFPSGIATVTAANGVAPYSYAWSNGGTTASIGNLNAGFYTVTVTDANGCSASGTVEILLVVGGLEIVADATHASCNGATDGSVFVQAYGGDGNYVYAWSNGATTATVPNLGAGTYFVTVTSAGQTNTGVAVINEPAAILLTPTAVDANGGNNGSASVTASNGFSPYSYSWSNGGTTATINNLAAGTYTVVVTDAKGCTATVDVVVNDVTPQLVFEYGAAFSVGDNWQTITLTTSYTSPVVIATAVIPSVNDDPVVTRVRNAAGNSFQLRVQQPGGATSDTYSVQYFVVEEGVYDQATYGIEMEAVRSSANRTAARGRWGNAYRETRSYQNSYQNPVVLGQVMSENDTDWSAFWASASNSRTNPPNSSGFAAGKMVAEDSDQTRANEELGYVVIEAGSGTIGGKIFLAGLGTDIVRGQQNSNLGFLYGAPNMYLSGGILSSAAMDGGDGGWPVFKADPLGISGFRLAIEEDQQRDNERSHTTEQVAYLVFGLSTGSQPAPTVVTDEPSLSSLESSPSMINDVLLYPNPVQERLGVNWKASSTDQVQLLIMDLNGRTVLEQSISPAGDGQIDQVLDVSRLGTGIYILQLVSKNERRSERFIIAQ